LYRHHYCRLRHRHPYHYQGTRVLTTAPLGLPLGSASNTRTYVDVVVSVTEPPTGKLAKCEHGPDTQIQFCSKVTTTQARRPDTKSTRRHARFIVHVQCFLRFIVVV
jgi:hypothetical protein